MSTARRGGLRVCEGVCVCMRERERGCVCAHYVVSTR